MPRYIDAEKLDEHKFPNITHKRYVSDGRRKSEEEIFAYKVGYNEAISSIEQFEPTADVVEVKHGKWLVIEDELWAGGGRYECSACGYGFSFCGFHEMNEQHYCPHCGARMEVDE